MLIGAHVSPAGGLPKAIERGVERGCRAIQIFNQSPRMWKPTVYRDEDVAAFREAMDAQPDRRGPDPRRLPAQLRQRGPRHPREIADVADPLAARRRTPSAPAAWSCIPARPRPATCAARSPARARRSARRSPRARTVPCISRTPPGRAERSGARSTSSPRCSRLPARASGSGCAWTPATCSPPAMTSARTHGMDAAMQEISRQDRPGPRRLAAPQRLPDAARIQPRPPRQHRRRGARRGGVRRLPVGTGPGEASVRAGDPRRESRRGLGRGSRAGGGAARAWHRRAAA